MDWFLYDISLRHERVKWENRHCSTYRFQVCQIKHKLLKKQKPNFAGISKENKNFIQQKYGEYTINRKECAALADDVLLHKRRRYHFQL